MEDKGNLSKFVCIGPFWHQLPDSDGKTVFLFLEQEGHLSHGKFYDLLLGKKGNLREAFLNLLVFKCLQLKSSVWQSSVFWGDMFQTSSSLCWTKQRRALKEISQTDKCLGTLDTGCTVKEANHTQKNAIISGKPTVNNSYITCQVAIVVPLLWVGPRNTFFPSSLQPWGRQDLVLLNSFCSFSNSYTF